MPSTWNADMNRFARHLDAAATSVFREVGKAYLGDIIDGTPVDRESVDLFGRPRAPGRLKRSWFTGVNAVLVADAEQSDAKAQMESVVNVTRPDATIVMQNGAPYAGLIEYGIEGGHGLMPPPTWAAKWPAGIDFQMPTGWVRVADVRFKAGVDGLVQGLTEGV